MADPSGATPPSARERLLGAALDLFHEQGVPATSVDQILQRSDTGKSQLYHYFGSKEGLVRAVVEDFDRRLAAGELPGCAAIRDLDDLERWFAAFVEFQRATGSGRFCPMATIAAGLDDDQEPVRQRVVAVFDRARATLLSFFEDQREAGLLPEDTSPDDLADLCYAVMQGGLLVSRVRRDVAPFERAAAQALAHVRRVLGG